MLKLLRGSLIFAVASLLATTGAVTAGPLNAPVGVQHRARDRGAANAAQLINISVHLKLPDEKRFENTVDALYDRNSPAYHKWLSDAQLKQFAPSVAEIAAVRGELERNGLTILSIANNGFSIRAQGTTANVARAFNTEIHDFDLNGKTFRSNTRTARLSGVAGSYVSVVAGLENHTVQPMLSRAINLKTKQPYAAVPLSAVASAGGLSSLITDQILSPPQSVAYTTPNAPLPTARYSGFLYGANAALVPDFTPKQLQAAYGLDTAYQHGFDGRGQTIVLLEAYGYPTLEADANAFSKLTGLPALTSANLKIVYPEGRPYNPQSGILTGWNVEIALDVQWAHAMAPGAKILVVASNGQNSEDFQASMQYIIDNNLGNVVSDSWEEDTDLFSGPAEQQSFESVLMMAAAKGISFQFSTGDSGDSGVGSPVGAAGVPSVSPHATAVGGTAIINDPLTNRYYSAGWGDTFDVVDGGGLVDPPTSFYIFVGGGGGGESTFWSKPVWQASLPGSGRQTPDISALADPYTGVPLVVYDPNLNAQTVRLGIGGTSLASPVFTAIWAIANQKAGHSLGLAAPTIAALKTGIVDVVPLKSAYNLAGSVTDAKGTKKYSVDDLFALVNPNKQDVSAALWDQPLLSQAFGFAFGLDTSLTVTAGWDNVTGYGTPHGLDFIFAAAAH